MYVRVKSSNLTGALGENFTFLPNVAEELEFFPQNPENNPSKIISPKSLIIF